LRSPYRIGLIVPSSNVTMETEIPAMLMARQAIEPERFTFHSSRMRMRKVTPEELRRMNEQAERCAEELADAEVDVVGYACLVAVMSMGAGYHRDCEQRLTAVQQRGTASAQVVSSAGALIEGIRALGATSVAIITPYTKPLTKRVSEYIEHEGIRVCASLSLEVEDNAAVGRQDPARLLELYKSLDIRDADAIVLSACVQMPSLPSIPAVEAHSAKPVISAAICTAYSMLRRLGLRRVVPNAGQLLSGAY
jgi:maleate isomerase